MARILTTEKDSEMNQTTNINISCEPKTSVETETNVPQYPPMDCSQIYPSVQARDIELTENINEQSASYSHSEHRRKPECRRSVEYAYYRIASGNQPVKFHNPEHIKI